MKRLTMVRSTLCALAAAALVLAAGVAFADARPGIQTGARTATAGTAQIGAAWFASYAIERDGSLWAWGANRLGELGLGDTKRRLSPQRVGAGTAWTRVAGGDQFCLALKRDGSLWAWGSNDMGQLGLGRGSNAPRLRPRRVGSGLWKAIGAGSEFSIGIKRDGSLWAWGNNYLGQLGLGDKDTRWLPTRVGHERSWTSVAVGYLFVLALKRDGSLWAWGDNGNDEPAHLRPTRLGSDFGWTTVSAGGALSLGVKRDGSLWTWGEGAAGAPVRIGTRSDWRAVAADGNHGLALKRDGSLWAWGENASGELGVGDRTDHPNPTRVGRSTAWTKIIVGNGFSLALRRDASLWAWGWNYNGQLGLGDRRDRLVPTRVTRLRQ
jgi:trimeric autotransporter adhesin